MTILLFILVLVVLILVHEFGHFIVAKACGMRVEEFGIGYPPRALTLGTHNGTTYTLNWLPFGGFVKIFGEDGTGGTPPPDSFVAKPRILQALVLVAGIVMNILLAWVLFSTSLALGMPRALSDEEAARTENATLAIVRVLPDSPADAAGLLPGDEIAQAVRGTAVFDGVQTKAFSAFVNEADTAVTLTVIRKEETFERVVAPVTGLVQGNETQRALGVGLSAVGTAKSSWMQAPRDGAVMTYNATLSVGAGLLQFFGSIFTLSADLSGVAGPVGIAGAVGDASAEGIVPLLILTALISINLALVNLLPIPALDGGRLLFVGIEAVLRRPLPSAFMTGLNTVGFLALILLMLVITGSDVLKLLS